MQDFDWSYNPRLPRQEILELISSKFVQYAADALLIGHPGTGKAILPRRLRCRDSGRLSGGLHRLHLVHKPESAKLFKLFCGAEDLLVIDDLFLKTSSANRYR